MKQKPEMPNVFDFFGCGEKKQEEVETASGANIENIQKKRETENWEKKKTK